MRRALLIPIIFVFVCAGAARSTAAESTRPTVLVFETAKGEGADKNLAATTTRAVRTYLRDTNRVEAGLFDRESPTVLRAIMENRLTAEDVAGYASRDKRLTVAGLLQFNYAAGAEVSIKDNLVRVKLWLGQVGGGKRGSWEATASALAGGGGDRDTDNAMQSATSAAVREIEQQALADVPRSGSADAPTTTDAAATAPDVQTKPLTASDYAAQAEASLQSGSYALAIQQYSQAVSADPSSASLRVKLADAYARKGLYKEAEEELGRAVLVGASADQIAAAKVRIEQFKSGPTANGRSSSDSPTTTAVSMSTDDTAPKPDEPESDEAKPANPAAEAVAKMVEGDKLWNDGKPDEAADSYRESIKLNPNDWRAYERLAAVNAQMSLFTESRKALERLNKIQPEPDAQIVANRYELFRKAFDRDLAERIRDYDSYAVGFEKRSISREAYFDSAKGIAARLESMAKFLDALTVPKAKQPANLRRSLACGLLASAANSLLDYLESNSEEAKLNAAVFASQARKETEMAAKLESTSKVIVENPPAPAEPSSQSSPP